VLRGLDDLLRRRRASGPTALVYGAGRRGAVVLREIMENPSLAFVPAGFIDDDEARRGERVEGVRVLGTLADLDEVLAEFRDVSVVIVSTGDVPAERVARLCEVCDRHGIEVRRFRASLEEVDVARPGDHRADVLRFPRL
jgi:FlaA1/EpsC-like NDP-sugar epimerase